MGTILLTGATGLLGTHLHAWFAKAGRDVVATDMRAASDGRDIVLADLGDAAAVEKLMAGIDTVVHFGAVSDEQAWADIQRGNIEGARNIFESARRQGVRRVIFASSYHVMGFHSTGDTPIRLDAPTRPDTLYALSKVFGENYGRYCSDRYGLECLVIRICTAFPPGSPRDARNHLDRDDLCRLVDCGIDKPDLGFRVVYGISDNPNPFFVNEPDPGLAWRPQFSSRAFTNIDADGPIDTSDPVNRFVGGGFTLPHE